MSKVKTNLTSFCSHLEKSYLPWKKVLKNQPEIVRKRITTGARNLE